jgi:hypothetical protein
LGPHGRPCSSQGIRRRRLLGSLRSAAATGEWRQRPSCWSLEDPAAGRPACARSTLKLCEFEGFSSRKQDRKWQAGQHPSCGAPTISYPFPAHFPCSLPVRIRFRPAPVCVTGGNAVAVGAESVVRGAQCTTPPIPNRLRQLPKCCVYIYAQWRSGIGMYSYMSKG